MGRWAIPLPTRCKRSWCIAASALSTTSPYPVTPRQRPLCTGSSPPFCCACLFVTAHGAEVGVHIRTSDRWCWWLRNAALSYEMPVQVRALWKRMPRSHGCQKGQRNTVGRRRWDAAHVARKKREPGRGHDDTDRPAIIGGSVARAVVIQATAISPSRRQKAADLAVQAGSRRSPIGQHYRRCRDTCTSSSIIPRRICAR